MNSELRDILDSYKTIESSLFVEHHLNRVTYDAPVNFNQSLSEPRHRWFPYKEGFSPSFVRSFFKRNLNGKRFHVLDPFAGVGTTVIEAARNGNSGVGIEINPLAAFVARAKTISLSEVELSEFSELLKSFMDSKLDKSSDPPNNATVISYFEGQYLDALLRVKYFLSNIEKKVYQDLFKIAFLYIIETFSTHRKAGNGLKKKTRINYSNNNGDALNQIKETVANFIQIFIHDISQAPSLGDAKFLQTNSLEMKGLDSSIKFDCVLTSPPYANCFDYSKIYLCELWLGDFFSSKDCQKQFRMNSVRSHVHARWEERYNEFGSQLVNNKIYPLLNKKQLWSKQIPSMLRGYFMDLGRLFRSLRKILKNQAPLGVVVGNSVYGGIPIATDLLISEIADYQGFKTDRIEVYRHIVPSSQQYVKLVNKDYLRESMVVLRMI